MPNGKPAWLHVFAGASNLVGQGASSESFYNTRIPANVEVYSVKTVNASINHLDFEHRYVERLTRFRKHSPAIAYANLLSKSFTSRKHIILLAANGNTGLWHWLHKSFYNINQNPPTILGKDYLRTRITENVRTHFFKHIQNHEIVFKSFLWMSGTWDAGGNANGYPFDISENHSDGFDKSGRYQSRNLHKLFADTRSIVGDRNPEHILLGLIQDQRSFDPASAARIVSVIRPAQKQVAKVRRRVQSVDTNGLTLKFNANGTQSPHFMPKSIDRFGECLFMIMVRKEVANVESTGFPCYEGYVVPDWAKKERPNS
ncbi:hypothetical protein N9383_05555 [Granulosicoccus sp.]|nr:hypothetical protein [Granulosicoccus sp.]